MLKQTSPHALFVGLTVPGNFKTVILIFLLLSVMVAMLKGHQGEQKKRPWRLGIGGQPVGKNKQRMNSAYAEGRADKKNGLPIRWSKHPFLTEYRRGYFEAKQEEDNGRNGKR